MALFIGLMSGTSADGIDAVLVDCSPQTPVLRLLHAYAHPLPDDVRGLILQLSQSADLIYPHQLAELDIRLGHVFADAVQSLLYNANCPANQVVAIGSHGQTIYHSPQSYWPYSWQIGNPHVIAQRTGITTVADFRQRDIAAGGQGAPLVPAFHRALFHHPELCRVVVNIGGIANITVLPADIQQPVLGFDTGPGNALMDAWTQRHLQLPCDSSGAWARSGQLNYSVLYSLLDDPYFYLPAPKSSGRDYFNLNWLDQYLQNQNNDAHDIQATLLALTVRSIANAIIPYQPGEVLVCGGGVHNQFLLDELVAALPCPCYSTAYVGLDPDWVEACCFAWLAQECLDGRPGNLPSVTGAQAAVRLGSIYPV